MDGTTAASGTIAAVTPGDPPYRSQELRAPEAPPEPWWPNLKRLLWIIALTACIGPCFYLFISHLSPAGWIIAAAILGWGLVAVVRGLRQRAPSRVWRGATVVAAGVVVLGFPAGDRCAELREQHIITAVHAWRTAHGAYPDSLQRIPPMPRSAVCSLQVLPNVASGRITYWPHDEQDEATLTRTLYGPYRRIYHFRTRRFTYLD